MLTETGMITKIERDGVWVESQRRSACGSCRVRAGCGQKLLSTWGAPSMELFAIKPTADGDCQLKVGDVVEIGVPPDAVVKGSLLIYTLPLALFIGVLGLAESVFSISGAAAIGLALLCFVLGFLAVRNALNSPAAMHRYQPQVVRKIPQSPVQAVSIVNPIP